MSDGEPDEGAPTEGITDETGEYGVGVDQDTGANVGDTGTPQIANATKDAGATSEETPAG
jgi:hypothetical protein